ncbi:hypothetical protein LTR91_021462 [Friedmanniomyces endolithicus]|uniref:Ysc84 actin-binding domain-containing protein n=1 Tax=Friedmanniomyces endolithicus TaxID=329885 RepID=A0AAN6H717_9PEZI|nr:hypothetical protein LTR94_010714 [Friedmanniomyces endolithicus]KAK0798124.1 hypothetical protein LTR38_007914 [Friedmanniomyces endolithicus]KAK0805463.1 hypothetical protein LTR59_004017 [Friedmanniomyces endolithicus]KAK0811262.1 hypothetical protein LTR75_005350 [Friedmanniomyces endolithicus]KAK0844478.1 hypothetical protein LTR03_007994 [Friedmanniomyces endolithicus]
MAAQQSSKSSMWDKTKSASNSWFQKVGGPVNKLSNKLGAEAFWPASLDKESDKAARILRSFCIDGFQAEQGGTHGNEKKHKSLDKIPPEVIMPVANVLLSLSADSYQVIRNCKGLAIFTVMRVGLHWSGAGGSGIIVAKMPDGQWSPPSGILIHTIGFGLVAGADIYDCVCVINNENGMDGFTRVRATVGGEISAAVGPLGGGSTVDSEVFRRQSAVWTYTKSKGLYLGVQIDGTIIVERTSENERFYGIEKVRNKEILAGRVRPPQGGTLVSLWETLQACEGHSYDQSKLPPPGPAPGDLELEQPRMDSQKEYDAFSQDEHMDRKQYS